MHSRRPTGDKIRVSLTERRVDLLLDEKEIERRHDALKKVTPKNNSPWEQFYHEHVGQLETGACLDFATRYHELRKVVPRHSH